MLKRIANKIRRLSVSKIKHIQYFFLKKIIKSELNNKPTLLPLITIFGSCRQDSIYNVYPVTSIRNDLTYTHYTKEIIQAIEFCADKNKYFDEYVYFRSSLLAQKKITKSFKKEFNTTDLFVIEIASRICYEYKGKYLHQEAYDNPQYINTLNEKVVLSDISDVAIEEDLIKLRELVYPKPLIVVTHAASVQKGKRYELVQLIKTICKKLNIPCIDPIDHLINYDEKLIFIPNDNTTHYTPFGHKIIQAKYKEIIEKTMIKASLPKLTQVYTNNTKKISLHSYHGFGDFLMGSLSISQYAKALGKHPAISFNNHPISNYLYNQNYISPIDSEKTKHIFDVPELIDFLDENLVFTNKKASNISEEDKQFLIEKCLQPRLHFEQEINNLLDTLNLNNSFDVLHIRGNDDDQNSIETLNKINSLILKHTNINKKYLLLSSSEEIINHINKKHLFKTNLKRCHSGMADLDEKALLDTLLEFMLMTKAKNIIQISPYPWGSNFSNIVAEIYNIPIKKYKF